MSEHDDAPDAAAAERSTDDSAGVDPKLLEILVCPLTKGRCATIASARN